MFLAIGSNTQAILSHWYLIWFKAVSFQLHQLMKKDEFLWTSQKKHSKSVCTLKGVKYMNISTCTITIKPPLFIQTFFSKLQSIIQEMHKFVF
jgi:hypothetical protein